MSKGRPGVSKLADATLEMLCARFPNCFVMFERQRRPLKVGIRGDIVLAIGEDAIDLKLLGPALKLYTHNYFYRLAQARPGATRIDLDGNAAGAVSEVDATSAARDVAAWKAKAALRRQLAMRKPRPEPVIEPVIEPLPPQPPRRLGLADLRAAAARRRQAVAT
jgi:sRNA-binding protein